MDLAGIFLLALLASTLTFFSGFGLGTLLLPAFLVLHPDRPQEAVLAVALVHVTNNLLKGGLTFKWLDVRTALIFGLFSAGAAAAGAAAAAGGAAPKTSASTPRSRTQHSPTPTPKFKPSQTHTIIWKLANFKRNFRIGQVHHYFSFRLS